MALKHPLRVLYERLQEQAERERGSSQVWHFAEIDGHTLYMADTSFGDGPIFRCNKKAWYVVNEEMITRNTTEEDLTEALALAERATWVSRFDQLETP